jgi:hypothetical protein
MIRIPEMLSRSAENAGWASELNDRAVGALMIRSLDERLGDDSRFR